jgi:hypothetical protein
MRDISIKTFLHSNLSAAVPRFRGILISLVERANQSTGTTVPM